MMADQGSAPHIVHAHIAQAHVGQCDCGPACVLELLPAATRSSPGPWIAQAPLYPVAAEGDWQVAFNPAGPVGVVALNPAARRVLTAFDLPTCIDSLSTRLPDLPAAAAQQAANVLAQVGLLRPLVEPLPVPAAPSMLSAWLHVSEACNLHCPYCYVPNRPHAATQELGQHAIDRLVDMAVRHGYASLQIKYAGGEPTLNLPVVFATHNHAVRRAAEAGLELKEVLLTNGVDLPDRTLDLLAQAGMRLAVSLDGGPGGHSQTRNRPDGSCTYDSVVSTIDRAVARGLQVEISITLTALNLDGVPDAVAFALSRELRFSLNFYRECHSGQQAVRATLSQLKPDPDRLIQVVGQVLDLARRHLSYPLPFTGILDRARLDIPHRYPCSAGRDYLTIDTNGRVAACQMLLEEPWTDLEDADPLATVRQRGQSTFRPVEDLANCHHCRWQTACSGGCPLLRESPLHHSYCRVYRTLLPELVRLEGKRLIALAARYPAQS